MRTRRLLKGLGAAALFVVVALLLLPEVLPPFLDRVYFTGPRSAHYDGAHFFNPEDGARPPPTRPSGRMIGFVLGRDRAAWPDHVPVTPGRPPAQVPGEGLRATWIGHSTVLIQTAGLNILTDPVWSERTGPFGLGPRRVREPGVRFDDLPRIDLVLVSHDHYDHMDLPTLERLWRRDRPLIVTSLGNDAILRGRGVPSVARDWGGRVVVRPGVEVIVERVHHWGSRWGKDRNRALWSGFTIRTPGGAIFFAGDTGWGDGAWVKEAAAHGPFRLAILPIGAFLPRAIMAPSHIGPSEAEALFEALHASYGLAVHWGTFRLSGEPIDAPRTLLAERLRARALDPARFRVTEAGQGWDVPKR